jgi:hypothetical protein
VARPNLEVSQRRPEHMRDPTTPRCIEDRPVDEVTVHLDAIKDEQDVDGLISLGVALREIPTARQWRIKTLRVRMKST